MCGRRSNLFNLSGTRSAKCRLWILTYVPYTYLFSRAISFHLEMHLLSRRMLFRVGHCVCVTPIYVYTRYFFDYYISSSLSFRFQLFFSFALSLWEVYIFTREVYIFFRRIITTTSSTSAAFQRDFSSIVREVVPLRAVRPRRGRRTKRIRYISEITR